MYWFCKANKLFPNFDLDEDPTFNQFKDKLLVNQESDQEKEL
jgi:hypothetical protein